MRFFIQWIDNFLKERAMMNVLTEKETEPFQRVVMVIGYRTSCSECF
ncbi:conserved hypothetical protein [Vibrio chagasii]|nr:conserved hypothetical protein [Vibrio chagasii]CDT12356.1 hypothetical protein VCR6J2_230110 [Vibrio coralliirubri]CAH7293312.1 conserved hypothetical protein [Vibrio chagasii]CDT31011.1 hypothetical protein VCR1J2_400011 [Vibrio coralliirubri]CDT48738.1 hypothetical protein VCR29J2_350067 [Vibrio coralliirubri]